MSAHPGELLELLRQFRLRLKGVDAPRSADAARHPIGKGTFVSSNVKDMLPGSDDVAGKLTFIGFIFAQVSPGAEPKPQVFDVIHTFLQSYGLTEKWTTEKGDRSFFYRPFFCHIRQEFRFSSLPPHTAKIHADFDKRLDELW